MSPVAATPGDYAGSAGKVLKIRTKKYSGYNSRNRFGTHQDGSKSIRITQKAIACRPEHEVSTRDRVANRIQDCFRRACRYRLKNPVAEIKRSSGRKDQLRSP